MIIFFGTRSSVTTLAMLTLACRNGHTAAHRLAQRVTRFTLFFIPLFPVGKSRFTVCTACGESLKLSKEQAAALLAQVVPAAPHPASEPFPQASSQPLQPPVGPPVAPPVAQSAIGAETVLPAARPRPTPSPRAS